MALVWTAGFANSLTPALLPSCSLEGGGGAQDSGKQQLKVACSVLCVLWMSAQDKSCAKFNKCIIYTSHIRTSWWGFFT